MTYRFPTAEWMARAEEIGLCAIAPDGRAAASLDFSRPFMPDALARTAALTFLSPDERRRLNQIRGNAFLTVSHLMEALAKGARPVDAARLEGAPAAFRAAFAAGFGVAAELIDATAVAATLEATPPLSRALLGLHLVWMAKRHVQAAALNERTLDPAFRRLFLDRWLAVDPLGGDGLVAEAWIGRITPSTIDHGVEGYRRVCDGLAEALQAQALLDLAALERACGRMLSAQEREQTLIVQHHAYWWTFLGCGLTHPRFAEAVRRLKPGALSEFDGLIATLP